MRLDKLLSNLGYGSRKQVTILLKQGRLSMDGQIMRDPSLKIDPSSSLCLDDKPLDPWPPLTLALHKPVGVVCDNVQEHESIFHCLPERWRMRKPGFSCAGRLDKDSHGLVIMSEDGHLVHRLISPKIKTSKIYRVIFDDDVSDKDILAFQEGKITLENEKPLKPVTCTRLGAKELEMRLVEGRNRQIRRMAHKIGNNVMDLQRIGIGHLKLDDCDLKPRAYVLIEPCVIWPM